MQQSKDEATYGGSIPGFLLNLSLGNDCGNAFSFRFAKGGPGGVVAGRQGWARLPLSPGFQLRFGAVRT